MLFLSKREKTQWAEFSRDIITRRLAPADFRGGDGHGGDVRANLLPMFHFYIGALLSAKGEAISGNGASSPPRRCAAGRRA